ncbi:MAG: arylformamidase [Bacillota bacterium]
MRLIDITHPLGAATAPWPGDVAFSLEPTARLTGGDAVNLSKVTFSPHNGTHADAPFHYDQQGAFMADVDLEPYVGRALLIALEGRRSITAADLRAVDLKGVERVLVRTGSCPDRTRFNPDFTYMEPEAVRYLASQGVRLLGTDAHSVDPRESRELPAHRACAESGILILENLRLAGVEPGEYELIALPLKMEQADGSPVRAVLREMR